MSALWPTFTDGSGRFHRDPAKAVAYYRAPVDAGKCNTSLRLSIELRSKRHGHPDYRKSGGRRTTYGTCSNAPSLAVTELRP
jgi:hypothetical protein